MPPVFTTRLGAVTGDAPTTLMVHKVPIGQRTIVRDLVVYNNAAAQLQAQIWIRTPGVLDHTIFRQDIESIKVAHLDLRQAMLEDDELWIARQGPDLQVLVTGYIFLLT